MKYIVEYLFKGQIVFTVKFEGEEWLSDEDLEAIMEEQTAIMRGQRIGIIRGVHAA